MGCAMNPVHTGQLLREMTDLKRLAEFPAPAYKTVQYSSYDRASRLPGGPGWFANCDGFGGEETPNFEAVLTEPGADGIGEYLICDVRGPGAIVRTWTAGMEGEIQLFLDDMATPLYAGPAAGFLLCPYRVLAGVLDPAEQNLLAGALQQQQAAYCAIPFARRCRLTWVGNVREVHFYHVQVRRYAPGAAVRTFDQEDLHTFAAELRDAARILADPDAEYPLVSRKHPLPIAVEVPPGARKDVLELTGPQALELLQLKLAAPDRDRALRQTILNVICDDHPWGQVQAPLGDFFGAGPGVNPFASLPFSAAPDGTMTCRYVMPCKSSLRIVLENRGDQAVSVTGSALPMDYAWRDDASMHFYARWRVDHDLRASSQAPQDMPFLIATGRGRYVGTALMLLNPCRVPSLYGSWWGEGDEKVFVDDDTFPSTFGTGSEDYFNYAWSVPDIFDLAYCGQPRDDGPGNRGFVSNYRWHILDDLPFHSRIAFYMELYPHDAVSGMSLARIGYYYARPGTVDDHVAITDEDVRAPELPPNWQPAADYAMEGALYYQAQELAQPGPRTAIEQGNLWAGGQLLVWHPRAAGEELALRFPVTEDGKYRLHIAFALRQPSGRVTLLLDGRPLVLDRRPDGLDLHVPHRTLARQFGTDVLNLTRGPHTLTIVYTAAAAGVREPSIGIDYLAVQRR